MHVRRLPSGKSTSDDYDRAWCLNADTGAWYADLPIAAVWVDMCEQYGIVWDSIHARP